MSSLPARPPEREVVALGAGLAIQDVARIADRKADLVLTDLARTRVRAGAERLASLVASGAPIYGLTTGFGPLADRLVDASEARELQENLVNHLATGVPPLLSARAARAVLVSRLGSLVRGASGASESLIDLLVDVSNAGVAPRFRLAAPSERRAT